MPGTFDESLINEVREHADIVSIISSYIPVTRKGKSYVALCPFHDDVNPSLMISPEKQIYKCFVCGAGGNAITFVSNFEHISFPEAVRKVASLSSFFDPRLEQNVVTKKVDASKEALYETLEDLTLYYSLSLKSEEGEDALNYLNSRGLDEKIQEKYRLGYAPNDGAATCSFLQQKGHSIRSIDDTGVASSINGQLVDKNRGRVIFPLEDEDGKVVGYSARTLKGGDEAKYINTSETPLFHKGSILYNYHNVLNEAKLKGYVYLVEGFMDVIALDKAGITSAVALMGTALTKEQIALLRKLNVEVRVCLDGDAAGMSAAIKISNDLTKENIHFRIVDAQGDVRDLDEILNQDGEETLKSHINNLLERLDFALNYYQRSNTLSTNQERRRLVASFIPILSSISDNMERTTYIYRLSKITGFEAKSIEDSLKDYKERSKEAPLSADEVYRSYKPEKKYLRKLELTEKEMLYQMLNNKEAVKFYEENVVGFYNDIYRDIATFLIDFYETHDDVDFNSIVDFIQMSDIQDKDELVNELTSLYMEKDRPKAECTPELLNDYLNTMNEEKVKIHEKDTLTNSIAGKDELEKSRIYNDFQKGRIKKGSD